MHPEMSQNDFSNFIHVSRLFTSSLVNGVVQQSAVDDRDTMVNFKEHLKTLRTRIYGSPSKRELKDYELSDVVKHYLNTQPIKKVFVKYGSRYVVKKYFTEGLQYVPEGETHIYEPVGKPLDIFLTNFDLMQEFQLNTLEETYGPLFKKNRVQPGQKGTIDTGAYYLIVAPCHTCFEKVIPEVSRALQISDVIARELPNAGDAEGGPARENQIVSREPNPERHWSPQPSTSREIALKSEIPRRSSTQSASGSDSEKLTENGIGLSSKRALSWTHERHSKREKLEASSMEQTADSHHSGRNRTEASNAVASRTVFGIRKSGCIESYVLESDSTLGFGPNDLLSGSFRMRNDDMDPYLVRYSCKAGVIQEVAHFQNDSTLVTHVEVQSDLLTQLREPGRRREKIVVNYFFNAVFRKIEAAYHRFVEMRNTGMIASCVPAIVQTDGTVFSGAVSDSYESPKTLQNK